MQHSLRDVQVAEQEGHGCRTSWALVTCPRTDLQKLCSEVLVQLLPVLSRAFFGQDFENLLSVLRASRFGALEHPLHLVVQLRLRLRAVLKQEAQSAGACLRLARCLQQRSAG
eukprot:306739-Rhodomonas_salina.2